MRNVKADALLPTNIDAQLRWCLLGGGGDGAAVDDVADDGIVLLVQLLQRGRGLTVETDGQCSPRHQTYGESSFLEVIDIL
jgi:hypothetical protein